MRLINREMFIADRVIIAIKLKIMMMTNILTKDLISKTKNNKTQMNFKIMKFIKQKIFTDDRVIIAILKMIYPPITAEEIAINWNIIKMTQFQGKFNLTKSIKQ